MLYSPDGTVVAIVSQKNVQIIDTATLNTITTIVSARNTRPRCAQQIQATSDLESAHMRPSCKCNKSACLFLLAHFASVLLSFRLSESRSHRALVVLSSAQLSLYLGTQVE